MSSSNYHYKGASSSYPQSSYSMSANTGGRSQGSSGSSQSRMSSYTSSYDSSHRFYATGQASGKSPQSMSRQLADWDRRWADASRR